MTAGVVETVRPWSRALRIAIRVALVAVASAAATFAVWFVGLDLLWAVATALALGSVGVVFAILRFEEQSSWDPHGRETPRGIRLRVPLMEESLAACDRLARPPVVRRIQNLLANERDDVLARATIVRQMRTLFVAELHVRGVAATHQQDEAVVALLGPDALTVLQPNDDNPVTSAVIANCLDAVERFETETHSSQ